MFIREPRIWGTSHCFSIPHELLKTNQIVVGKKYEIVVREVAE